MESFAFKSAARRKADSLTYFSCHNSDYNIRNVGNDDFFEIYISQRSPRSLFLILVGSDLIFSAIFFIFTAMGSLFFFLIVFAVYSLNAAVKASASLALKKTRYFGGISHEFSFQESKKIFDNNVFQLYIFCKCLEQI